MFPGGVMAARTNRIKPSFQRQSPLPTSSSTGLFQKTSSALHERPSSAASNDDQRHNPKIPKLVYRLNASTKWWVTIANTLGIWTRVHSYKGPFIVVGAILSVYLTEALKQIIRHDRPDGAPFTDPGMPSSHALVSTFMAAAWTRMVYTTPISVASIWVAAGSVALLRVICGYHSWDQIMVGSALGSTLGYAWAKCGAALYPLHPQIMLRTSWCFYAAGSAFFVAKNMKDWVTHEKHL